MASGAKRGQSSFAPKHVVQIHKAPQQLSSSDDEDDDMIFEIEEIDPDKAGPSKGRRQT